MERFLEEFDSDLQLNNFQPHIGYRDFERSPFVVTTQTFELLELHNLGIISNFSAGRDYLKDFTADYIRKAEDNCDLIFDRSGKHIDNTDVELREAVVHAYTVFSWLPDMTAIPAVDVLKDGFARNGMLKSPLERDEFKIRTRELKIELAKIAFGTTGLNRYSELGMSFFRTYTFFKVAAFLNPGRQLIRKEKVVSNRPKEIKFLDKFSNPEIA